MGIADPQYWLQVDGDMTFPWHLELLMDFYGSEWTVFNLVFTN
jgi:hypothetical protein